VAPTTIVARIYERFQHVLHELGKFGVVGIFAFILDTIVFASLRWGDMEANKAKIIATVISASAAFVGNRFWTWRHRERSGLGREYLLYFVFNAAGLGITLLVLNFSHSVMGAIWPIFATKLADVISSQFVGNAIATVFRFWSYRRFVFLAPAAAEATQ
jgi:putative flippase GtrA